MTDLSGRIALVTGTGPNIGRAIAVTLGTAGAHVFCNDIDADAAAETVAAVEAAGGQATALPGDITDETDAARMVTEVVDRAGRIDILVNNAGISVPKRLIEISLQEWNRNIGVILTGSFLMAREVAKHMIDAEVKGVIVNIASTSGHKGRGRAVAYTTAKGGILNFTRSLAVELAPYGIRVNSVSPTKTGPALDGRESKGGRSIDEILLGREGEPQDHANAVLFMVSDQSSFITGEDIRVDGGAQASWGPPAKNPT